MSTGYNPGAALAAPATYNIADQVQNSALKGLQLGQQMATFKALRGVDFNDPATVDNAIQGLVRAGSGDQANALLGLNLNRQLYQAIPGMMAQFTGQGASGGQPQGQPQGAPRGQGQPDPDQVVAQHQAIMKEGLQTVQALQALPPAQRPAAVRAAMQHFTNDLGVPQDAVAQALGPLVQPATSPEEEQAQEQHLQQAGQFFQAHMDDVAQRTAQGDQYAGTAPAAPWQAGVPQWAQNYFQNPPNPILAGILKSRLGVDLEPYMQRAAAAEQPGIAAQAAVEQARQTAPITVAQNVEEAREKAPIAVAQAGGVAGAEAAAKGKANLVTVKDSLGAEHQGTLEQQPDGTYAFTPLRATGGTAASGVGVGPTPQAQQQRTDQAQQAAKALEPNPQARQSAQTAIDNDRETLSLLNTGRFTAATPFWKNIVDLGRAAGLNVADPQATSLAIYEKLAAAMKAQQTRAMFAGAAGGRITNMELTTAGKTVPTFTTPNDAIAYIVGMDMAGQQRTADYEDFKAGYQGPKDNPGEIQSAWLGKEGGQSLYQSPVWKNITLGGKPAVDTIDIKGKTYGVFAPGLGHPVVFPLR
jgi:hypothetical protein